MAFGRNHRPPSRFRRKVEALEDELDFDEIFERMEEIERSFADLGLYFEPIPRRKKSS